MPDDALPDGAQNVLDYIASGEARDYNVLYGGGTFNNGYADHPRQRFALGNGLSTDAAGKYQFLSSTWDREANKLGLTNFNPASQDQAAWDLASSTYKEKTGRALLTDYQDGKVDWGSLSDVWPSLARGTKPKDSSGTTSSPSTSSTGDEVPAGSPDRLGMLSLLSQLAPQHQLTPVEYDPFSIQTQGVTNP